MAWFKLPGKKNKASEPSTSTSSSTHSESNDVLRVKFQGLHTTVVNNVNAADVIHVLFQEKVIGRVEFWELQQQRNPLQQCGDLLALLHKSDHPEAFTKLYTAKQKEGHLQWLVDRIDQYTDESVVGRIMKELHVSKPSAGQVVHTMAEAEPVCGLTVLGDNVYLLRLKQSAKNEIEVYDAITFKLRRCLTVPNARGFNDMTSCKHFLCLYIADHVVHCIHRLDVQGSVTNATQWPVNDEPDGLSVSPAHNVLVTCRAVRKVKVISSRGNLVREIQLPADVTNTWHTMQLLSGELLVCHGSSVLGDAAHRVVVTSSDGRSVLRSHGGQPISRAEQCNGAIRLAVANDECVFVVDLYNRQVT